MTSYFPTAKEIMASDQFGADLTREDMGSLNFARKPWAAPHFEPPKEEEEQFVPSTPGDVDFLLKKYLVDAQVPSAHSEQVRQDARDAATDALEKWGTVVDPETYKRWQTVAETGREQPKTSWFNNFINVLDTPGELGRMLAAQAMGLDKQSGGFTIQDYVDSLMGNEANVVERHPWITSDEGSQYLATGSDLIKELGWNESSTAPGAGKVTSQITRGLTGFLFDVALDPLTYVSFGTLGFGKKAAMEAARSGTSKMAKEGLEAMSKGTVNSITDTGTREYVQRVARRVDDRVKALKDKGMSPIEAQGMRNRVRSEVVANERLALQFTENVPLGSTVEGIVNLPGPSILQDMVEDSWAKLADKQFRSLAKESPWFVNSKHVEEFAKGGVHIGTPFGTNRFSLLRIPGSGTDRAVTGVLGRKYVAAGYEKLPQSFRSMMSKLGRRSSVEAATYDLARRGQLWDVHVSEHAMDELVGATLDVAATAPLNQGIHVAREAFGNDVAAADRALARVLAGDIDFVATLKAEQREAVRIAAYGSVEQGVDGIHQVLQTFWDAARRSGMDLGFAENYVPRVMVRKFAHALDDMAAEGIDVAQWLDRASSTDSRMGMELLSRYSALSGDISSGRAIDPSYAKHADETTAMRAFQSGLGGEHMDASILALDPAMAASTKMRHIPPHQANDYMIAALEDLQRFDPQNFSQSRVKALSEAFETDMTVVLSDYLSSMSNAIRFRETVNQFRRIGLVADETKLMDVAGILASVNGRLSPATHSVLAALRTPGPGVRAASRLVDVKIGGRTLRVPAAVKASPRFGKVAKKLSKALSTVDRRGREISAGIERNAMRMIGDGIPEEWAWKMALAETDTQFAFAFRELADIAREEVTTLRMGVAEMGARNMGDVDDMFQIIEAEAREMARGVEDVMRDIQEQVARKLDVPTFEARAIDLMDQGNAPKGYANPLAYLADQAMESIARDQGSVEAAMAAIRDNLTLGGATRPQIASEAVRDLADRLIVTNVTVGDVANFATPGTAARALHEANLRLVYSGYAGVGSLSDEMAELADAVLEAENLYWLARNSGEGVPQLEALRQAERALNEAAQPLRQSDELMGDIVDHMADSVEEIDDIVLTGDGWREVWATAIHKQGLGSRAEFREAMLEGLEKGLPEMTQKELLERGSKSVSRDLADMTRSLWTEAGMGPAAALAKRANDSLMIGDHWAHRAIAAMRAGDMEYMSTHVDQVRLVIGRINGKDGRPLFDLDRLNFRNGRFVYEQAETVFVTLDDILPDLVRIVNNADIDDFEVLALARRAWDINPADMEKVNPLIGTFMRQLDSAGGLPRELDDYDYLRRFVAELRTTADEAASAVPVASVAPGVEAVRTILDMVPQVYRQGGRGPAKLGRVWDETRELIEQTLPVDEFDRLASLVGMAQAGGRIRPPVWRQAWKDAMGTADEAFDTFTSEIAGLRRLTIDEGEEWGAQMAADIAHFHNELGRVMSYSNLPGPQIRPGYKGLVEEGGEFSEALAALNRARGRVRAGMKKARKDKTLTQFLPEVPETGLAPDKWIKQLIDDLDKPFEIVRAPVVKGQTVRPSVAGVAGEAVDNLVMSPAVAAYLENLAVGAAAMISPLGIRLATQALREATKWWKSAATVARPTFVPRNLMGGIINGLLIGVGPKHYAFVRNHVGTLRKLMDSGMLFDEALAQLPKKVQPTFRALWDSKLLTTSFSQTLEGLKTVPKMSKRISPWRHENILFEAGGKLMQKSEDFLRAAAFVRWYDPSNPASAKLAKEMALVAHFDYTALTSLEDKIRRLVPFFVWTRRNVPLQLRAMMEQPGHILRIKHFTENMNATFDDTRMDELGFAKPEWLSSFAIDLPLVFGEDSAHWSRLLLNPDIPVADVEELFSAFAPSNSGSASEWLLRSLTPLLSTPITSLGQDYETVAPTGLREIMMVIDALPVVDLQKAQGRAGGQYMVSGSTAGWFNTALPFLGEWVRVLGIVPSGGSQAGRAGYNIEDGISGEERLRGSALALGRSVGTHLQTPNDTYTQAWNAIFAIGDEEDRMQQRGYGDMEDMEALIEQLLRREGQSPYLDPQMLESMFEREGFRSGKSGRYGTSR